MNIPTPVKVVGILVLVGAVFWAQGTGSLYGKWGSVAVIGVILIMEIRRDGRQVLSIICMLLLAALLPAEIHQGLDLFDKHAVPAISNAYHRYHHQSDAANQPTPHHAPAKHHRGKR